MRARQRSPFQGREGAYFHKQVEGITKAKPDASKEALAVVYVARHRQDLKDFEMLIDELGLNAAADKLHTRRAS